MNRNRVPVQIGVTVPRWLWDLWGRFSPREKFGPWFPFSELVTRALRKNAEGVAQNIMQHNAFYASLKSHDR